MRIVCPECDSAGEAWCSTCHGEVTEVNMTKREYAEYEATVDAFFNRDGIDNLTSKGEEGYVSSHGCDCCGNSLQQVLYEATGYNREKDAVYEYQICEDCVMYGEYGRLDDTKMSEIEKSKD